MTERPAELLYERARRLWAWALLSPLAYLAVGVLLQAWDMLPAPPPLRFSEFQALPHAPLFFTGLLLGLLIVVVFSLGRGVRRPNPVLWWRRFLWSLMLADTLACAGLVGWYLTHRAEPLLLGGLIAYLGYAAAHPRRREVDSLF